MSERKKVSIEASGETGTAAPTSLLTLAPGLAEAIRNGSALDIGLTSVTPQSDEFEGGLVVLADTGEDGGGIADVAEPQAFVLLREVLQHVEDERTLLRTAFSKVDVGGFLIVTVPHQFLWERKHRLPSRYNSRARRFYTPATLLMALEEALNPTEYRVRTLLDDDAGYDYQAPIEALASGRKRIVLIAERINRPAWADRLSAGDEPSKTYDPTDRVVKLEAPIKVQAVTSFKQPVNSVLVLKLDHRGDFVLAHAAFQDLRRAFDGAKITLVCGPWNVAAAEASGLFDEIISLAFFGEDDSAGNTPSRAIATRMFASLMRGRVFDLAIDLRFFDETRGLLGCVTAITTAGFDRWNSHPDLDVRLTLPSPTVDGRADQGVMLANEFGSQGGVKRFFSMEFCHWWKPRRSRTMVWGPYRDFPAGRYRFEFHVEPIWGAPRLVYDVTSDSGQNLLARDALRLSPNGVQVVDLTLHQACRAMEFRLFHAGGIGAWRFSGVRFVREGQSIGLHQSDAMQLLVKLVTVRLARPYRVEAWS